jgi:hypothetical protein
MSGDFERWDNRPSQSEAPKPEENLAVRESEWKRRSRRFVWFSVIVIVILIGLILWNWGKS